MKLTLPYGTTTVEVEIPAKNLISVSPPNDLPPSEDINEAFRNALGNPIGTPPLEKMVKKGDTVAIVIDDITRPTPSRLILERLLKPILARGVRKEDIVILVALGLHRPLTEREIRGLTGDDIFEQYRVLNHEPWNREAMTYLGKSKSGNNIWINSILAEADVKILTGLVRPHPVFGYTGGRKSILPGISDGETVLYNHRAEWHLFDPNCDNLVIENNPAHLDALDIAKRVGVNFIVNVVLNRKKEIVKVVAGDVEQAWREGVSIVDQMSLWEISERADIIVSTPGGYPSDQNLYQSLAVPTRKNPVFRDGATIITATRCEDGVGEERMYEILSKAKRLEDIVESVDQGKITDYELASYAYAYFMLKHKLSYIAVTDGVSKKDLSAMFIESADSVQEAVDEAFRRQGKDARVLVIPDSKNIIPRLGRET